MSPLRHLALAALVLCLSAPVSLRAQAGPQQPGGDAAPQPGAREGARGQGRGGMGRAVRGTVVSASGPNVTVKTESGESWTVITTDNTRVNIDRQPIKVADVKAGDEVMAVGIVDAEKHQVHAMMLAGASAAQVAKLKADMGKTYIVGRVTAINDTKLTVERPDHIAQTITLDETTSLKRGGRLPAELMAGGMLGFGSGRGMRGGGAARDGGAGRTTPPEAGAPANDANSGGMPPGMEGESITLADVKVGDNVAGTGSVKAGTFVPTELHVLVRPQRSARPPGGAAGSPGQP